MGAGKRSRAAAAATPAAVGGTAPAGKAAGRSTAKLAAADTVEGRSATELAAADTCASRAAIEQSDAPPDVPALELAEPERRKRKGRLPVPEQDGPVAAEPAGPAASAVVPRSRNEVLLVGRVAAAAEERALPSGDLIVTWRLVVERPRDARPVPDGVRVSSVDTFLCVAWAARERVSALELAAGDVVQVQGALRRRFWRSGGGVASVCEVEVTGLVRGLAGG